jgi:hypothetical protein
MATADGDDFLSSFRITSFTGQFATSSSWNPETGKTSGVQRFAAASSEIGLTPFSQDGLSARS